MGREVMRSLYAYTPYDETPRPAYVLHYDGRRWSPEGRALRRPDRLDGSCRRRDTMGRRADFP